MGKKYCEICNKKCKSYAVRIDDSIYVHSDCFRCSECRGELELSKFYFKNKFLYCIKDFKKLYYPKCVECAQIIEDEMVKVMDRMYHLNCLHCSFCRATSKHGDKLNFDGKNLICRECTLISIRVQSINKASFETSNGALNATHSDKTNDQASNDCSVSSLPKIHEGKKRHDAIENYKSALFSPTGKPPLFPSKKTVKAKSEAAASTYKPALGSSKNFSLERSSRNTKNRSPPCSEGGSSYLDWPSGFRRGPSFNVSHAASAIHHFHVPSHVEGMQKLSRSKTLPKTTSLKPKSEHGSSTTPIIATSGKHHASPSEKTAELPSQSLGGTLKNDNKAVSRDTLPKTPLLGISEDGMSIKSHASLHLPSKGYALKPGYGLKPIVYAFYGTSPESKQHLFSGAVSMEDSKDTKSVSLGSDCYSSFYSAEDEENLDPYTGLKRNRSIRSTVSHDPRLNRSKTLMEMVCSKRPITVSQFLKRVDQSEKRRDNMKKYSLKNLKVILSSPEGRLMKKEHLEDYLLDEEFQNLFSMERIQFQQLPEWKKTDLKEKHNLC